MVKKSKSKKNSRRNTRKNSRRNTRKNSRRNTRKNSRRNTRKNSRRNSKRNVKRGGKIRSGDNYCLVRVTGIDSNLRYVGICPRMPGGGAIFKVEDTCPDGFEEMNFREFCETLKMDDDKYASLDFHVSKEKKNRGIYKYAGLPKLLRNFTFDQLITRFSSDLINRFKTVTDGTATHRPGNVKNYEKDAIFMVLESSKNNRGFLGVFGALREDGRNTKYNIDRNHLTSLPSIELTSEDFVRVDLSESGDAGEDVPLLPATGGGDAAELVRDERNNRLRNLKIAIRISEKKRLKERVGEFLIYTRSEPTNQQKSESLLPYAGDDDFETMNKIEQALIPSDSEFYGTMDKVQAAREEAKYGIDPFEEPDPLGEDFLIIEERTN